MRMIDYVERYKNISEKELDRINKEDPERFETLFKEFRSWKPETEKHRLTIETMPEEWEQLKELSNEYDLTPSQLIQYFVIDLIGDRGQGSDERALASQWYSRSRCNFK